MQCTLPFCKYKNTLWHLSMMSTGYEYDIYCNIQITMKSKLLFLYGILQ